MDHGTNLEEISGILFNPDGSQKETFKKGNYINDLELVSKILKHTKD